MIERANALTGVKDPWPESNWSRGLHCGAFQRADFVDPKSAIGPGPLFSRNAVVLSLSS